MFSTERKILFSRFLTRSGDQAWDFVLPLTLVTIFPSRLDLVASVFLISKLGTVILQPWVARIVDSVQRLRVAMIGTTMQVSGLLFVTLFLTGFREALTTPSSVLIFVFYLGLIALGSLVANLGSGLMDIAVGNDWVPKLIPADRLTAFNSKLRQLDLATEVGSPIVAGLILLLNSQQGSLLGFYVIAGWNVVSFLPEILLLKSVFFAAPELQKSIVVQSEIAKRGLFKRLFEGWSEFRVQTCMPAMVAYAFLWLSVLSPHGVLLTAFLKDGWNLPEAQLGFFRGLGAVFGLLATLLFPIVTKKMGLQKSTRAFIFFQAATVTAAGLFFVVPVANGALFLCFILLSRIGLYGFSLGEMEIRQRMIPEGARGVVNGAASSLTGLATVVLFALGAVFSTPERFSVLVAISVAAVISGTVVYSFWVTKQGNQDQTR